MKKIILALLLLSCATQPPKIGVEVTRFDSIERQQLEEIRVFSSPEAVAGDYIEIGLMESRSKQKTSLIIERFKEEARLIGANAIILLPSEEKVKAYVPLGGMVIPAKSRRTKAIAIILKES